MNLGSWWHRPSHPSLCLILAFAACAGNALYAVGTMDGMVKYWSPALVAGALIAFMIVHGLRRYSGRILVTFAITIFSVGWTFESLSILSGFPFGSYHYTELMAPFLGHVPVFVMPAYCVMGYICWSMAGILVSCLDSDTDTDTLLRWGAPVVAAALMVVWDLSMDPLRATVEQRWIWRDGGAHLGVPLENFFGWAFVTWIMFQVFSLALTQKVRAAAIARSDGSLCYWLSVPLAYASFATEYVLNPFVAKAGDTFVPVNEVSIPLIRIYEDVAVVAASTMVPLALFAGLLAWRTHVAVAKEELPGVSLSTGETHQ